MNTTNPYPLIQQWLAFLADEGKASSTVAAYSRDLGHFVHWIEQTYNQPFDPAAVIRRDLADYKAGQQTAGVAPATINRRLAALSRFFKWVVSQGHVAQDPTVMVKSVRQERQRPKGLDETELRRLLRAVHRSGHKRDIALVELLAGTGLRVSEAVNLKRKDIQLSSRSGLVIVRRGKGGVHREVPLTTEVRRALTDYLESQTLGENDPLWVGQRGPLQDRGALFLIVRKYARQAQIAVISPHDLRHTFATRYLRAHPGDLRNLAAILGHASLDTVMIYTEPTTEELAAKMEAAELAGFPGQ